MQQILILQSKGDANLMQSQIIQFSNRIALKRDQLCYSGFANEQ